MKKLTYPVFIDVIPFCTSILQVFKIVNCSSNRKSEKCDDVNHCYHGDCFYEICYCYDGWTGDDCSLLIDSGKFTLEISRNVF